MLDPATIANRFGLGARPGDSGLGLLTQLDRYDARPAAYANVPTRAAVAGELAGYLEDIRQLRADAAMGGNDAEAMARNEGRAARQMVRGNGRDAYLALVGARANAALNSPAPFVERMVHFWANHFAISADKLTTIGMGGLLEAEAIRPYVLGKFSDMLLAVEQHPAMLLYLDQAQSIGPDSRFGQAAAARTALRANGRKIGLNENLAREIMELHTLGVRTGYSQADVTELARALTGWTVAGLGRGPLQRLMGNAAPGSFVFVDLIHQPGDRQIMGRRYAAAGEAQGRAVLLDLAAHPATARHVATKLARHFAGDMPPPALVERLAMRFTATGGDLPALYRALVEAPELQGPLPAKFKTPWDWSLSALRAVGTTEVQGSAIAGLMTQLGQPVLRPGSPAGWDDIDASWAGPDALVRRVEAAARIATRAGGASVDVRRLAAGVLPGGGNPATLAAIARAESPVEGLSLMLVAPEFLRR
jgi:uncharacterized protein (DUF1800 family)